MHRSRAAGPALSGLVVHVEGAALLAAGLVARPVGRLEAQCLRQEPARCVGRNRVGANALEALERELGRDLRVLGAQRLVVGLGDGELEVEPLRVREAQLPDSRETSTPSAPATLHTTR